MGLIRCRMLAAMTAGLALVVACSPPASGGFPVSSERLRRWAPEQIGLDHSHTRSEAVATAKAFDVIVAVHGAYRGLVDDMRAANPDLVILVYLNGTFAQQNQRGAFPRRWYARTRGGEKIRSRGYGNYLMLPSRPGWVDHVRDRCARFRRVGPYDGCFVDMLGTSPLDRGYLTGRPINPATGKVWTKPQWLKATSAVATKVRIRISPHLVAANGLRNGQTYFGSNAPSERLLRAVDGACAESWMRVATQRVRDWPTVRRWKKNVNMLRDAGQQGKSVLVLTKLWVRATEAQKKRWHRFALASFLLGDNGRSYFFFTASRDRDPTRGHPWWNRELGDPLGSYVRVGGVFQREFEKGRVLVNPTNRRISIDLGSFYVDLSGTRIQRVTLGPHGAEVLRDAA
jgi:hypothetical protein